ncbi:MAG: M48 family metalloprotease [Phycisphaerales bacterium JB043]
MVDPHILLIVLAVLVHDAMGITGPTLDSALPPWLSGLTVPLGVILLQHLAIMHTTRCLTRSSDLRWVEVVRWMQRLGATIGLVAFLLALFGHGWLAWVRTHVGDMILVDEALAVLPALLVIVCGWFSSSRMEQVLRDAVIIRRVEAGQDIHPPHSRLSILLDRIRHRAALILLPIALLVSWSETVSLLHARALRERWLGLTESRADLIANTLEFGAIVVLIVVMPLMLRLFWRTSELGPGTLRDTLESMCKRHRVRVRSILVWWTHGTMLNGAVIGILRWTRMILLTDELLATLRIEEIESVMAHEIAHIKRHHIQWMLLLLVGALLGLTLLADLIARAIPLALGNSVSDDAILLTQGVATSIGLLALIHVFGVVSRRFERQADAFAVQHASGMGGDNPTGFGLVAQPVAIEAMAGSLERIAAINGIPMRKRMYRHGSLASRVSALRELVGVPLDHFDIDRVVRRTKRTMLLVIVLLGGVLGVLYALLPDPAREKAPTDGWVLVID